MSQERRRRKRRRRRRRRRRKRKSKRKGILNSLSLLCIILIDASSNHESESFANI